MRAARISLGAASVALGLSLAAGALAAADTGQPLLRSGNGDVALFDAAHVRNDRLKTAPCLACHRPRVARSVELSLPAARARALQPPS